MRFEGKVYRPWPEAESVLLQVTLGCSVNTYTFCNMFRDKKFSIRPLEDIFQDIESLRVKFPAARCELIRCNLIPRSLLRGGSFDQETLIQLTGICKMTVLHQVCFSSSSSILCCSFIFVWRML